METYRRKYLIISLALFLVAACLLVVLLTGCGGDTGDGGCKIEKVTLCTKWEDGQVVDTYTRNGWVSCRKGYYASHDTSCK